MVPSFNSDLLDRTPPADLDAEAAYLSSCFILGQAPDDPLDARDFHDPAHRLIARAMEQAERIDITLVAAKLRAIDVGGGETAFDRVGVQSLTEIASREATAANVAHYANLVRDAATKRRLIQHATDLLLGAFNGQAAGELVEIARTELERLTVGTHGAKTERELLPFRPFPLDLLPPAVGELVKGAARSIGCDSSFVGLPCLAVLASAIGNTRRIELKTSWQEPSILWPIVVAESGDGKSPAMQAAVAPLWRAQALAVKEFQTAMEAYEANCERHELAKKEWRTKGHKSGDDPPTKPTPPTMRHFYTDDATIEGLADILDGDPRGGLLARDELSGWLASFDAYRGGRGGDAAKFLTMHGGRPLKVDRKTGKRTTFIRRASLSITGTIQPTVLQSALGELHVNDGMAARFLLAAPPYKPQAWTDATISTKVKRDYDALLVRLAALQFATDDDGDAVPLDLPLTPDAKREWVAWFNRHKAEQAELSGAIRWAWSKLEGAAARLALVLQLGSDPDATAVEAATVWAACELADWFGHEAKRLYGRFGESRDDRELRELAEWIAGRGGRITARELAAGNRRYRHAGVADAVLQRMKAAGFGNSKTEPTGGRDRTVFVLAHSVSVNGSPDNAGENDPSVDVDTVADGESANEGGKP